MCFCAGSEVLSHMMQRGLLSELLEVNDLPTLPQVMSRILETVESFGVFRNRPYGPARMRPRNLRAHPAYGELRILRICGTP